MRIVTAHTMVEDLRAHFERAGFRTSMDGDGTFLVSAQDGGDPEESKAEILLMLRVWSAMHPETTAQAGD
jgi:hypothetical protein